MAKKKRQPNNFEFETQPIQPIQLKKQRAARQTGCLLLLPACLFLCVCCTIPTITWGFQRTERPRATEARGRPTVVGPSVRVQPTITERAPVLRPTASPASSGQSSAPPAENVADENTSVVPMSPQHLFAVTNARIRACPSTACAIWGNLPAGGAITAEGTATGEVVSAGNSTWYAFTYQGQRAYIHSSLVSTNAPVAVEAETGGGSGSGTSGGGEYAGPAEGPTQFTCPRNCDEALAMGLTAEQAGTYPNLDRDRDGLACYGT